LPSNKCKWRYRHNFRPSWSDRQPPCLPPKSGQLGHPQINPQLIGPAVPHCLLPGPTSWGLLQVGQHPQFSRGLKTLMISCHRAILRFTVNN
jgi:hypothetical protein